MKKRILNVIKWILIRFFDINIDSKNNVNLSNRFKKVPVSNIRFNIVKQSNVYIPKNVFFINVGDYKKYMDYSLNSFKLLHTDFKVEVLNYTYDEFFKQNCVWNILQSLKYENNKMLSNSELNTVIVNFAINKLKQYGGIYIKNTTFTCRNINKILKYESFVNTNLVNGKYGLDYSLIGCRKDVDINNKSEHIFPPIDHDSELYNTLNFSFYNCTLQNVCNQTLLQPYCYNF